MQFAPKTDKEINEANLIPHKTVCDFEIIKAENTRSKKSGAEMITLQVKVFHGEGFRLVNDYLMEAMAAKLRHFCEAGNLMRYYEGGTLRAEHCVGICGKAKIKLVEAGDYPAKNDIADYVVPVKEKVLSGTPGSKTDQRPEDDDVPF